MRPAQKSNRSRGRSNRKNGGGGGGININRVYDSSGPEGKVRGTPQQIIDRYLSLARDAQTSDDRVLEQSFLQHAEHYQRILITAMGAQEQARREANAAQPGDNQPNAQQQPGQHQPVQVHPTQARPVETGQPADPAPEQPAANIGGIAMIDSTPAQDNLLVDAADLAPSPPRANGENRRRRRKPESEIAPAEKPEESAETTAPEAATPEAAAEG